MTIDLRMLPRTDPQVHQSAPPGLTYVPGFLSHEAQQALLQELESLSYSHDKFRGQQLKRSQVTFGWDYIAVGRRLRPAPPLPDFLLALVDQAQPQCPADTRFDMCLVQRYPAGAGIGFHTDAPCFGDVILGISLGASGRLQFRPSGSTSVSFEQGVEPGALYVMRGPARRAFQHQVVPVKGLRHSLTFRQVTSPPAG